MRAWLAEAEREDDRVRRELDQVAAAAQRRPLQIHPGRAQQYLEDLHQTLAKGGLRARQLLQGDIKQIKIHRVAETTKPFARAEVISTGEGLLGRVAFVVAGAGFEPATFGL